MNHEQRLAKLLLAGLEVPGLVLVRSVRDRTWMFFEYRDGVLQVMPAGLAVIGALGAPWWDALARFQLVFPGCGWQYDVTAERLTRIPHELLIDANRAHDRRPLVEMIYRLNNNLPLIECGSGPRIIDRLSDSQG